MAADRVDSGGDTKAIKAPVIPTHVQVRNATEEFGFTPRDVFDGVFNLPITTHQHATVKRLTHSKLKTLSKALSCDCELDGFSDRVVGVQPRKFVFRPDHWTIHFISAQITREVAEPMRTTSFGILITPSAISRPALVWREGSLRQLPIGCSSITMTARFLLLSLPRTPRHHAIAPGLSRLSTPPPPPVNSAMWRPTVTGTTPQPRSLTPSSTHSPSLSIPTSAPPWSQFSGLRPPNS